MNAICVFMHVRLAHGELFQTPSRLYGSASQPSFLRDSQLLGLENRDGAANSGTRLRAGGELFTACKNRTLELSPPSGISYHRLKLRHGCYYQPMRTRGSASQSCKASRRTVRNPSFKVHSAECWLAHLESHKCQLHWAGGPVRRQVLQSIFGSSLLEPVSICRRFTWFYGMKSPRDLLEVLETHFVGCPGHLAPWVFNTPRAVNHFCDPQMPHPLVAPLFCLPKPPCCKAGATTTSGLGALNSSHPGSVHHSDPHHWSAWEICREDAMVVSSLIQSLTSQESYFPAPCLAFNAWRAHYGKSCAVRCACKETPVTVQMQI